MIVRTLARPLLATIFITEGIETLRNPAPRARAAEPVIDLIAEASRPAAAGLAAAVEEPVERAAETAKVSALRAAGEVDQAAAEVAEAATKAERVPGSDAAAEKALGVSAHAHDAAGRVNQAADTVRTGVHDVAAGGDLPFANETYVKANAAVQVGAGLLLATGKFPRLAATALAATLVPTTVAGHRFWEATGEERRAQRTHFFKNVSLLGGLILASVDTEGQPGLAWRAEHAGHEGAVAAKAAGANAVLAAQAAKANARAAERLTRANAKVAGDAGKLGIESLTETLVEALRQGYEQASVAASHGYDQASDLASRGLDHAGDLAAQAGDLASQGYVQAGELASDVSATVSDAARDVADRASEQVDRVRSA